MFAQHIQPNDKEREEDTAFKNLKECAIFGCHNPWKNYNGRNHSF